MYLTTEIISQTLHVPLRTYLYFPTAQTFDFSQNLEWFMKYLNKIQFLKSKLLIPKRKIPRAYDLTYFTMS